MTTSGTLATYPSWIQIRYAKLPYASCVCLVYNMYMCITCVYAYVSVWCTTFIWVLYVLYTRHGRYAHYLTFHVCLLYNIYMCITCVCVLFSAWNVYRKRVMILSSHRIYVSTSCALDYFITHIYERRDVS